MKLPSASCTRSTRFTPGTVALAMSLVTFIFGSPSMATSLYTPPSATPPAPAAVTRRVPTP